MAEEVTQRGSKKTIGIVALVVGIVVAIVSLIADVVGIGNPTVFGPQQIVGTIGGAVVAVVGLFLTLRK
jgi:Na+(H+)/acetate symporter ActP